ncbi:glycosyltransferase [bacterium]|nr:glycosyltransferase [bacterium]
MFFIIFLTLLFTVFYLLLIIIWIKGLNNRNAAITSKKLNVSVIIPTHNAEDTIPSVIESLNAQTYPSEFWEVIFVDDRSTDKTGEICKNALNYIENSSLISITNVDRNVSPKKNALLNGINKAKGEIILTTDSDTVLPPGWIESMVQCYRDDVSMVLGYAPYRTDMPFDKLFHKILALEYFSMGAVAAGSCGAGFPLTSFGANLSFRKKDFFKIGGYGDTISILSGDDDLLMHRFRNSCKNKIIFNASKESHVKTDPPADLKAFIRQRIRFSSKHLAYPLKAKLIMGTIYIFHLLLLILLISTLFNLKLLPVSISIIFTKSFFELYFLNKAKKIFNERRLLRYYFPAFLPHLLYVVFIPIFAQIAPEKW